MIIRHSLYFKMIYHKNAGGFENLLKLAQKNAGDFGKLQRLTNYAHCIVY